jgi:O-antigen ligase
MGVLAVVVGVLLRRDWERRLSLRLLVYIGTLRGVWTLGYFLLNGYPGRRFNVLVEGAALVILLGLVAHDGWTRVDVAQAAVLLPTVLIGQERKVWVAIAGAVAVMGVAYAFRTRDGYRVGLTLLQGTLLGAVLGVVGFLLLPPDVQARLFSLIALVPGVGGQPQFERAYLVGTGLEMFAHNPLFGVGPENWFEAKATYATDNLVAYERRTDSDLGPHSIFVKTLAETGAVGFVALLLLLVRPLRFVGWYLKPDGASPLCLPLAGLFCFTVGVAAFRGGGFVDRAYLFLLVGFLLSFELHRRVPASSAAGTAPHTS